MPFGLANAPATFYLYIYKYLAEKLNIFIIEDLDDIFIYTNEKDAKYEEAVRYVLKQLQKYRLYINLKKCYFNSNKVYFLGYIILFSGVHIETEYIDSIKNWLKPQSIREI